MVIDNVVLNKCNAIRIAVARVLEEYADNPDTLKNNTKLDAILLNLQRACESSIDLAMHIVRVKNLGVPQFSRDAFELMARHGLLSEELANNLKKMVGFRNAAVHQYQTLDIRIVQRIIESNLSHFEDLISVATA